MGVRIMYDSDAEHTGRAALYDSVTETAFGPLFMNPDEAQELLDWLGDGKDPRAMTALELDNHHTDWLAEKEDAKEEEEDEEEDEDEEGEADK